MKILSWNVNGIRAAAKKGFISWLEKESPDILGIQETKASPDQLDSNLLNVAGYFSFWNSAQKKGYSGVGLYTKKEPCEVKIDFGKSILSDEGRVIECRYEKFILFNVYFPNGKMGEHRIDYKLKFYGEFLKYVDRLKNNGEKIIFCGDVNTAHTEIDLARPKENAKISGFMTDERKWIDKFIISGYIDTFREFNKEPNNYSWWDLRFRARDRNVGWRIDYFFVSKNLRKSLKNAFILKDVAGSDHAPVGIEIDI